MGTTRFGAGISLLILLVFQTLTVGIPPMTWWFLRTRKGFADGV